ncbi:hypothetical protein QS257_14620 [Terrilactibacillus sp. S3-3]|nr:hypothetical protein QS257_14620 [Terrilactibacillus sp. S3-3]
MGSIVSFKLNPSKLKLVHFIDFYGYCEKRGQTIYVYGQNKAHKIERLSELLSFLLFSHDEECLIVIEGSHVNQTKAFISKHFPGVLSA